MNRLKKAFVVLVPLLSVVIISGCLRQNTDDSTAVPATATSAASLTPAPLSQERTLTVPTPQPTPQQQPSAPPAPQPSPQASVSSTPDSGSLRPGQILSAQFLETVSVGEIATLSLAFYTADDVPVPAFAVHIFRLTVASSNELGEIVDLQTDLFIPDLAEPAALPVVGYAPGTTGIGDGCAPSLEAELNRPWGSYRTYMLSVAGQGYIGVLPDGQNYDDPARPHEYFISELEAYTLLDATRAVYNFLGDPAVDLPTEALDAVFFGGYSNGGHTAFAAKDFAETYAPELPIRGIISHGATTNVETLLREAPVFSPYLIYAYRYYFGSEVVTPEAVFAPAVVETFEEIVPTHCVDELYEHYLSDPQVMYNEAFLAALRSGRIAVEYPLFGAVLNANYAGIFGGFDVPVAFFQGTGDFVVTPAAQEKFAQDLCAKGQPVTYVELPAVDHAATRQHSFDATLAWMQQILAGETPDNNCADLGQ